MARKVKPFSSGRLWLAPHDLFLLFAAGVGALIVGAFWAAGLLS